MKNTEEKIAVYQRAKEILMEDGWTQGVYESATGRRCLVGAVFTAAGWKGHVEIGAAACTPAWGEWMCPVQDAILATESGQEFDKRFGISAVGWNDTFGRTADEVIDVLDATIIKVKEEARG